MLKVVLVAMFLGGVLGASGQKLADNHDKAVPDLVPQDSIHVDAKEPERVILWDYDPGPSQ